MQQNDCKKIIAAFTSIGFIIQIDNMFSIYVPEHVKKQTKDTVMILGNDENSFRKIAFRLRN